MITHVEMDHLDKIAASVFEGYLSEKTWCEAAFRNTNNCRLTT